MNIYKLSSALEILIDKVSETALKSPEDTLPDNLYYAMQGKIQFAQEIKPMLALLKKFVQENEEYEELRRSYQSSDKVRLEEFVRGDGVQTRTVVELDGVEQKATFNELLENLTKVDT